MEDQVRPFSFLLFPRPKWAITYCSLGTALLQGIIFKFSQSWALENFPTTLLSTANLTFYLSPGSSDLSPDRVSTDFSWGSHTLRDLWKLPWVSLQMGVIGARALMRRMKSSWPGSYQGSDCWIKYYVLFVVQYIDLHNLALFIQGENKSVVTLQLICMANLHFAGLEKKPSYKFCSILTY